MRSKMFTRRSNSVRAWAVALSIVFSSSVFAAEERPAQLQDIGIDPVLGTMAPLDGTFQQEDGKTIPFSAMFDGKRPTVLVLAYYGCPMLCGLVLKGVSDTLQRLDWAPGDHYRIVTISIDPKEDAELAAAKKKSILGAATNAVFRAAAEKNWHFLVGKAGSEKRVADAMGFRYKWDPEEKQWAHGAAIFFLSPTGKLTRVLFGLDFPPQDVKLSLLEAGEGKVGTLAEKLLLFCYHYDPKGNKYAILATRLMSLGGAVTVIACLLAWYFCFVRVRKHSERVESAS